MRVIIFILCALVLISGTAVGENTPVGQNRWQKDDGKYISTFGDAYPLTYQKEDQAWDDIVPDWVVVNDTTAKVVKGIHRLFAFKNGNLYYVRPRSGVRHALGLRASKLIKFKLSDSSYTVLSDAIYDSVSIDGVALTYHNIFPGVDRVCIYDNVFYQDKFVFNQEARDTLATQGPWAGYLIGVVSKIDKDSLNLSLKDRNGVFSPTVGGRITDAWMACVKADTIVFCLQQSFLETEDSVTSVPVYKRVVTLGGNPYLVELFNPVPTASWPEGPVWHNVVIGYDSNLGADLPIELAIGGMSFEAISTTGTLDSGRAYVECAGFGVKGRMAVYSDDGARNYVFVDSIPAFTISNFAVGWKGGAFVENSTVNSGTRYMVLVWGSSDASGSPIVRYRTTSPGSAQDADSMFYDASDAGTSGWGTITQSLSSEFQKPVSIIAFYTEEAEAAIARPATIDDVIHRGAYIK